MRRDRLLLAGAWLCVGPFVVIVLAAMRATTDAWRVEHAAEYSLGGGGHSIHWEWVRLGLRATPGVTALLALVASGLLVSSWWGRSSRADGSDGPPRHGRPPVRSLDVRAGAALAVIVGANVTSQVLKLVTAPELGRLGTLPSGHATLAASSGCAVVLLAPQRRRVVAVALGAACAAWGALGVVCVYWHVPGDAVAGLAVVASWMAAVHVMTAGVGITSRGALQGATQARTPGDVPIWLAAVAAAAWVDVLFWGWGSTLVPYSPLHVIAGLGEYLMLPLAGAGLVLWSAAVAGRVSRPEAVGASN